MKRGEGEERGKERGGKRVREVRRERDKRGG